MTGARVLAIGGTIASLLSMVGGWLLPRRPRIGAFLLGAGPAVMLVANVTVSLWEP